MLQRGERTRSKRVLRGVGQEGSQASFSSPLSEAQITLMSVHPLPWMWLPADTGPPSLLDHTSVWLCRITYGKKVL